MLTASPLSGQYFCNWVAEEYSGPFEQFDNFNGYLCRETTPTPTLTLTCTTATTTTTTTATSGAAAAAASFIQNHHLMDSPSSENNNLLHHQQAAALLFSHDDIIDDDDDDEDNENDNDCSSKNSTVRKTTTKKLNHNASERDRRKRINSLYSSLRSLLPPQDQAKKLSIPSTVSRVLKYIPELQKQVDNLIHRKETVISRTCSNNNITNSRQGQQPSSTASKNGLIINKPHRKPIQQQQQASSLLSFSANTINLNDNKEMIVQWSVGMPASESSEDPMAAKAKSAALLLISEVTQCLEDEGFLVINASCVQPFKRNMLFCNMHLQAQGDQMMDAEMLKEKILSLCVK